MKKFKHKTYLHKLFRKCLIAILNLNILLYIFSKLSTDYTDRNAGTLGTLFSFSDIKLFYFNNGIVLRI